MKAITVEDFAKEQGYKTIDLLKIDTEGYVQQCS